MLKKIPAILSPELIKILMEMGHGDEIVFADANFPAASHAQRLIRYDGTTIKPLLEAVSQLFPLDYRVVPAALMKMPSDYDGNIQEEYKALLEKYNDMEVRFDMEEREDFYGRAARAYAIVTTSDTARFANIILRKGVVKGGDIQR